MVFFTCNACGQCVKKAQVEKHYLTECRNCEVLSCIDCGKDFVGDDYKHHTKCVSENEKYGGKDYNAKPNKGEVKQSQWIESIQAASSLQSVSPRVRSLLQRLADYSNIPRKKAKFERFIQNSLKVHDKTLIEQIWTVYSEAGNKQKTRPDKEVVEVESGQKQERPAEEGGLPNGKSSGGQSDRHALGDVKKTKKKDKHCSDHQETKNNLQDDGEKERETLKEEKCFKKEIGEGDGEFAKKKKKKRKDKERHGGAENDLKDGDKNEKGMSDVERTASGGCEPEVPKKEKKKKHKKSHAVGDESLKEEEEMIEGGGERREEGHEEESRQKDDQCSKKPKKKRKHLKSEESQEGGVLEDKKEMVVSYETSKSSAGGEDDAGLAKTVKKEKRREKVDQMPRDEKKRKRKRSGEKSVVSDDMGDDNMDGLLSLVKKRKRKTTRSKGASTGLARGDSGKHVEKSNESRQVTKNMCLDHSKDTGGMSEKVKVSDDFVEKGAKGLHDTGEKKKKKTTHKDKDTDHRRDSGNKVEKKIEKRIKDGVTNLNNNSGGKVEKKKKKKSECGDASPHLESLNTNSGKEKKINGAVESRDLEGVFVPSKTKKLKKRKLGGDSSETTPSDEATVRKKKKKEKRNV